jgi:putative tryptophan/tyrosine transport system substrate-binding protein
MKRRNFMVVLAAAAAWPGLARAQQPALPVVGYLNIASSGGNTQFVAAFRQGLKDAGFIEGQNVAIDFRFAEGRIERMPAMAAELVGRPVRVIVTDTAGTPVARAATSTIPIVFLTPGDPVRAGFVASFNRPGGNVTGVSFVNATVGSKRLELLRELVPGARTIALLMNPTFSTAELDLQDMRAAAQTMGLRVIVQRASNDSEIDAAFTSFAHERPDALLVLPDSYLTARRAQIVALEARLAIPAMHSPRDWVVSGGLVSYGSNTSNSYRQGGVYAGRILKGEKPADLPVVQPTKFELVINLKTAKALGLEVPPTLLALADEVIE